MPPPRSADDHSHRTACLLLPDLPLAAERRAHPELEGCALAVATGAEPRAEVVAVSPEAAALGVRRGMTVAQARAACAELRVRVASAALARAAREALLDAALSTSPRARAAAPATGPYATEAAVVVDARGVDALFRSERGFAGALAERARQLGLPAAVAVAGSAGVARIAARRALARGESALVVPPDGDAAFLAPLPLDLLGPDDALAEAFTRFGLRRVADLVRIPERALATRLGPSLRPFLDLARGILRTPPPPAPPPRDFAEAAELEVAVDRLEPLLFVLRGALSRLAARLACRGLACADLELRLGLEGGGRDARRVGVAAPTTDVSVLLRLVALSLETRPPRAAIERVRVATSGAALRGDQLDFFRPPGPPPAVWNRTLAELAALCGEGRVGAPARADLHRPDAFAVQPPASPSEARARSEAQPSGARCASPSEARARSEAKPSGVECASPSEARARSEAGLARTTCPSGHERGRRTSADGRKRPPGARSEAQPSGVEKTAAAALALRALRPPLPVQVHAPHGAPERVRSALANGAVVRCAGPWRSSGHWWSAEERWAFEHYDVQTSDGLVTRLRYDALARAWQIDGVYD